MLDLEPLFASCSSTLEIFNTEVYIMWKVLRYLHTFVFIESSLNFTDIVYHSFSVYLVHLHPVAFDVAGTTVT